MGLHPEGLRHPSIQMLLTVIVVYVYPIMIFFISTPTGFELYIFLIIIPFIGTRRDSTLALLASISRLDKIYAICDLPIGLISPSLYIAYTKFLGLAYPSGGRQSSEGAFAVHRLLSLRLCLRHEAHAYDGDHHDVALLFIDALSASHQHGGRRRSLPPCAVMSPSTRYNNT